MKIHRRMNPQWEDVDPEEFIVQGKIKVKDIACRGSGLVRLDYRFEKALITLVSTVPFTLHVNSCCRETLHNICVGGHKKSLHLIYNPFHTSEGTMAIDFSAVNLTLPEVTTLLTLARNTGWSIGHGYDLGADGELTGFIHLDRRFDLGLGQKEFYY